MDVILGALRERRDDLGGVFYEVFSRTPRPPQSDEGAGPAELPTVSLIRFNRSDREAMESEPLLAFAEDQGLHPSFACRAGACGTCRCRVVEGEVATTTTRTAPLSEGEALICISRPVSKRVVLDL